MLAMAKPAYLAMVEHAAGRPTICFVASRKQCKLTVNDILTYCLADEDEYRFLAVEPEELEPHLERLQDRDLAETLKYGIGYYHEALSKLDKRIVTALFEEGAIKVLIASKDTAWSLPVTAFMVVIMGVQVFDGQEHRYVDYAIADVLQMMGRACRSMVDTSSRCVLMCQQTRKDFFKKFLNEALPVESSLPNYLHDHFNAEIVAKTIENKQDAVDWCTWTWFYRRLMQNPGVSRAYHITCVFALTTSSTICRGRRRHMSLITSPSWSSRPSMIWSTRTASLCNTIWTRCPTTWV
jgi:pre-mRNA-splicing helicase BRR2